MKVVTFSIFKGGTAKTTSTVNTAAALAKKGLKVLVVDLDQQASATRYLDLDPEASPNLYEVFMGTQQAPLAVRKAKHGVDVLTSHVLMAAIEEALEPGDETKLSSLITPLRQSYDFILIDTPPGKAMLAFNGLAAADLIIIPASAERMWRDDHLYDVVVVMDHNERPRVQGRGSAVFMHVARDGYKPTAGCIAFKRSHLLRILKLLRPGTTVRIAPWSRAPSGR